MRAALLLLLFAAAPAAAYQREDHAATVRLALRGLKVPLKEEVLVAACAQLPDEAAELSAIDVYRRLMKHPLDYARWASRRSGPADTAGRMAAVQQLLHGLTGGSSEGVRVVARETVAEVRHEVDAAKTPQERADAACALGFAFHLYGDSFAHSRLRNPARMYDTGVGHLFDSTKPDLPLVSKERLALFGDYLRTAASLLKGCSAAHLASVLSAANKHATTARERNGYNEAPLRLLLQDALSTGGALQALAPFDRSKKKLGCQALIDAQAAAGGVAPAPRCERAWELFRDAAEKAYDAYDAAHPETPSRDKPRADYYRGPLFEKGVKW